MSENAWQAKQTSGLFYYNGTHWFVFKCSCGRYEKAKSKGVANLANIDIVTRARTWCRGCGKWWKFEYVAYEWRKGLTFRLIPDGIHWSFVHPPTLESLTEQIAELTKRVECLEEDLRDRGFEARGYGE